MKRILQANLALLMGATMVSGQNAERNAPRVPQGAAPVNSFRAGSPAGLMPDTEVSIIDDLKGVVIVDRPKAINPAGARGVKGLDVRGPAFLNVKAFERIVAPYLGQRLTNKKLAALQRDIVVFCRAHDHPVVDVAFEEQEVVDGVIQITVLDGKLGKVNIKNEGDRWFQDERILHSLRLQEGDSLIESMLVDDINWINRNPFREVSIQLRQGEVGKVDLDVDVKDRLPLRVYTGYENSLTPILGEHMVFAGFNWGNVFGWDHQLNYQFSTDVGLKRIQSHSGSYVVPLPWRHTVTVFGSYSDANPDLSVIGFPAGSQKGTSYQASIRYAAPLPKLDKYEHELSVGFDYKRSDNNLEFGGVTVFNRASEIGQYVIGYRGALADAWGQTTGSLQGFVSPGAIFDLNNNVDFNAIRPQAVADYYYVRVDAERVTRLPAGFTWSLKGTAQFTEVNLLPSEQLGVGGNATVRGYDERVANGDEGWILNNEVRTPAYRTGNLMGKADTKDTVQFHAFYDYGSTRINLLQAAEDRHKNLSSVGGGIRYSIGKNVSMRLEYGFQLTDKQANISSRGHAAVLFSF